MDLLNGGEYVDDRGKGRRLYMALLTRLCWGLLSV